MATNKLALENPGIMMVAAFFALFVVNSLVVWLASLVFPEWVVLGTSWAPWFWALIHSMGALTLINTFAIPFVREYEKNTGRMLGPKGWMMAYFLINLVGVWVVARFSDQFGFGIKSWMVAVFLALILDFVQGIVMMQLQKFQNKLS